MTPCLVDAMRLAGKLLRDDTTGSRLDLTRAVRALDRHPDDVVRGLALTTGDGAPDPLDALNTETAEAVRLRLFGRLQSDPRPEAQERLEAALRDGGWRIRVIAASALAWQVRASEADAAAPGAWRGALDVLRAAFAGQHEHARIAAGRALFGARRPKRPRGRIVAQHAIWLAAKWPVFRRQDMTRATVVDLCGDRGIARGLLEPRFGFERHHSRPGRIHDRGAGFERSNDGPGLHGFCPSTRRFGDPVREAGRSVTFVASSGVVSEDDTQSGAGSTLTVFTNAEGVATVVVTPTELGAMTVTAYFGSDASGEPLGSIEVEIEAHTADPGEVPAGGTVARFVGIGRCSRSTCRSSCATRTAKCLRRPGVP
ncbi:MAG: hypothetical protein U5J97_10240 [Trueperaceae bacterium]|nr:hypothetical protein [Trueperaceae bacterium]